jgi:predicted Ser/Thr protein kinase
MSPSTLRPVSKPLRPGDPRHLGGYELLARLGQGGMGTVYLGRAASGRLVAIKVVRAEYAAEDEFRARFRSEVTRARQVPPFCTAEVLDADPEHRTPYLVVEYVDGPNLAEVVGDRGPLADGSLHSVAIGVATALAAIHGARVIHRDLKPANVLFSLGTPKVIDFGIARALEVTSQHTKTDQMVGTVAYMSPERFDGDSRTITPAADVFAWGAVVAYAASGRTPFAADSAAATAARILTQPPRLTGLSGQLRDLVALTLAKEPADRPTAHELLDLLLHSGPQEMAVGLAANPELRHAAESAQNSGRYVTGDQPGVPLTTVVLKRPSRRTPKLVAGLVAAGLVAVGLVVLGALGAGTWLANRDSGAGQDSAASLSSSAPSAGPSADASHKVLGPSVYDRLDRPGLWQVTSEEAGSCDFVAGELVVSPQEVTAYPCPGPADTFTGDQSITVDVRLQTADVCAIVWFRYVGDSGYRVAACATSVAVTLDDVDDLHPLSTTPLTTFTVGSKHLLGIAIHDNAAAVTVDGRQVTTATVNDPSLLKGKVVLGATGTGTGSDCRVGFSDVDVKAL